jgi:hypothetical protein
MNKLVLDALTGIVWEDDNQRDKSLLAAITTPNSIQCQYHSGRCSHSMTNESGTTLW